MNNKVDNNLSKNVFLSLVTKDTNSQTSNKEQVSKSASVRTPKGLENARTSFAQPKVHSEFDTTFASTLRRLVDKTPEELKAVLNKHGVTESNFHEIQPQVEQAVKALEPKLNEYFEQAGINVDVTGGPEVTGGKSKNFNPFLMIIDIMSSSQSTLSLSQVTDMQNMSTAQNNMQIQIQGLEAQQSNIENEEAQEAQQSKHHFWDWIVGIVVTVVVVVAVVAVAATGVGLAADAGIIGAAAEIGADALVDGAVDATTDAVTDATTDAVTDAVEGGVEEGVEEGVAEGASSVAGGASESSSGVRDSIKKGLKSLVKAIKSLATDASDVMVDASEGGGEEIEMTNFAEAGSDSSEAAEETEASTGATSKEISSKAYGIAKKATKALGVLGIAGAATLSIASVGKQVETSEINNKITGYQNQATIISAGLQNLQQYTQQQNGDNNNIQDEVQALNSEINAALKGLAQATQFQLVV